MKSTMCPSPRDLKLKTGVFLGGGRSAIAIFAIKYQPSRNVEWAPGPCAATASPGAGHPQRQHHPALLKRKFRLDARPLYLDISTRLALSELTEGRAGPTPSSTGTG